MTYIRVAAASINQTPLAWDENTRRILEVIEEARREEVSVLCLPELCVSGYHCEDAFFSINTVEQSWDILVDEIAPATKGMVVAVGLPTMVNNGLFNAACLLADGDIVGLTAKRFLAGEGIYYEPRWFRPWPSGLQSTVRWRKEVYPIGDQYYDVGGVKIGFEICEDAWVANRPGMHLSLRGADIILNPSASHFAFGKYAIRERLVLEGSRAFGVSYVYANHLGNDAGRVIFDGGAMIASGGNLLQVGPRFSFRDWDLTSAVIDVGLTRMARARTASFTPNLEEGDKECVKVDFDFGEISPPQPQVAERADWEKSARLKEEEFTRAVTLGLFDYLRKSFSQGFVVSLSGGADSSACATLVRQMVEWAVADLGPERFCEKLGYMHQIRDIRDDFEAKLANIEQNTADGDQIKPLIDEVVKVLLVCAYQRTKHSSETTFEASRVLAEALSATFYDLDVQPMVDDYVQMMEAAIGRELTWERDDITLQNIQARTRSPGIWMLANIRRSLLLATSNRSEAAVGYTTMDGDTSGGLSPIAGIDKAFLRQWLRWMEREGPSEGYPVKALKLVNVQQPTAELRPQEKAQTDEGDLMPYDLLDAIERAAIRDKKGPWDAYALMRARFPHYNDEQLLVWVERFFRLWSQNQWKRERYAPSFHLDDENLDPKTWCRWPILSGGFRREMKDLRAKIEATNQGEEGP